MAEPRRLPNGRWQIRYRDPQGRPRSKVCDTKSEARNYVQEVGPCHQVKPLDIQAWMADLPAGGMAPSSVNRKYGLLRRLMQVADDKGLIARSPRLGVEPPKVETNEMPFLTPAEVSPGGDLQAGRSGRWVRQKPKTRAGVRSISISGFLAEQLEEQLTTAVGR